MLRATYDKTMKRSGVYIDGSQPGEASEAKIYKIIVNTRLSFKYLLFYLMIS